MAAKRGAPRAASYLHISDNLYIKFDNNDKKGNLGNQWQSLISSPLFPPLHVCKIFAALLRGQNFLCLKDSLGKTFGASRDIVITAPVGDVPKNQWYNCFCLSHKERQIFGSLLQLREGFTKKSSCSFGFCHHHYHHHYHHHQNSFSSRRLPVATWAGLNVCAWDKYNDKYSVPCIAVRRTEADISGTDGFKQLVLDQS